MSGSRRSARTTPKDPRLDVLLPLFDWRRGFAVSVLNSLDAVDPKRRLLDTLDALDPDAPGHEALTERLAEAWWNINADEGDTGRWDSASEADRHGYREDVRMFLRVLREAP